MNVTRRLAAVAVMWSAVSTGCASFMMAQDSALIVSGQVFDDRTQAGRVALEPEDVQPVQRGQPVAGCAVRLARRTTAPGTPGFTGTDTTDPDGRFSVFGGREPGSYDVTLAVDCPGYAAVEHVFLHRGPRSYKAAVFVERAP